LIKKQVEDQNSKYTGIDQIISDDIISQLKEVLQIYNSKQFKVPKRARRYNHKNFDAHDELLKRRYKQRFVQTPSVDKHLNRRFKQQIFQNQAWTQKTISKLNAEDLNDLSQKTDAKTVHYLLNNEFLSPAKNLLRATSNQTPSTRDTTPMNSPGIDEFTTNTKPEFKAIKKTLIL
jgi:hypothetical protein